MTMLNETTRRRTAGVVLIALIIGVGVLTVAMYNKAFTKTETVTIVADRAGLQMRKGTVVKYAGVDVGKIKAVRTADNGTVEIDLAMIPDMIGEIPADVDVALEQLTAFGNKGVVLRPAGGGEPVPVSAADALKPGDTLEVDHIAVEANQLLADLDSVLTVLEPAKVNATLSALSQSLDGQGEQIGESLETAERYLARINDDLPTLERDLTKGATVLDTYTAAAGNILGALDNITTTADTLTAEEDNLEATLTAVKSAADTGTRFTTANTTPLGNLLRTLLPTTAVLEKYAPVYECTMKASALAESYADEIFGSDVAGVQANLGILAAGGYPYDPVEDAPVTNLDDGPNCWGMPDNEGFQVPAGITDPWDPGLSEGSTPSTSLELNPTPLQIQLMGSLFDYIKLEGLQ